MSSTLNACVLNYVSFTQSQQRKKRENGPRTKKKTIASVIVSVKDLFSIFKRICTTSSLSFGICSIATSANVAVSIYGSRVRFL